METKLSEDINPRKTLTFAIISKKNSKLSKIHTIVPYNSKTNNQ